MADKVMPGPVEDMRSVREAVCVHTRKIYDSLENYKNEKNKTGTVYRRPRCFFIDPVMAEWIA